MDFVCYGRCVEMLMGISVELQRSVEEATGAVPTKLTGLAVLVVAVVSSMETVGVGDLAVWSLLGCRFELCCAATCACAYLHTHHERVACVPMVERHRYAQHIPIKLL